jgi:hypothetical protein
MLAAIFCESPPALRRKFHGSVGDFPFVPFGDFDVPTSSNAERFFDRVPLLISVALSR